MTYHASQISADVRALADALVATPVGDVIGFESLSEAIGTDIRARRYLLHQAMRVANKEVGALFSSVRGEGYKRLPSEDAALVGGHARHRIRKIGKLASVKMERALEVANDISDSARKDALSEISVLGLVRHIASDKSRQSVNPESRPQPIAITMRGMMDQLNGKKV